MLLLIIRHTPFSFHNYLFFWSDFQTDDDIRRKRIERPTIRPIPLYRVSIYHIFYIVRKSQTVINKCKKTFFTIKRSSFFGKKMMIGELDLVRCLTSTDENPLGSDQLLDLMILADRFEMDSLKVEIFNDQSGKLDRYTKYFFCKRVQLFDSDLGC